MHAGTLAGEEGCEPVPTPPELLSVSASGSRTRSRLCPCGKNSTRGAHLAQAPTLCAVAPRLSTHKFKVSVGTCLELGETELLPRRKKTNLGKQETHLPQRHDHLWRGGNRSANTPGAKPTFPVDGPLSVLVPGRGAYPQRPEGRLRKCCACHVRERVDYLRPICKLN